jgi:CHAD domain-containing protein
MSSSIVVTLPGSSSAHRGLSHWMDRVLKELENVRKDPGVDPVHDLRVAIRRCRSVAAVLQEVDPDPSWREMRRLPRKLFRRLGQLRDAQVMDKWVKQLAPSDDPLRPKLHAAFAASQPELCQRVLRAAKKFDDKSWTRLERKLRKRARMVPSSSLAAQCLAVERMEEARDLHTRAQRTDRDKPWHELRIGLKRLRYTVENLLPDQHALWSDNLKRLQDLLGDVHDLDVLAGAVKQVGGAETVEVLNMWQEIIHHERSQRVETYRQLTLGKTSLWNDWRHGLPQGKRLALAAMARLRATARATDTHPRRTAHISRISVALFDALRRAHAAPAFGEHSLRRVLRAAARLHNASVGEHPRSRPKAARRFLHALPLPPSWTFEEWELLEWSVRYHRGPEPSPDHGAFAKLPEDQKRNIQALAGILRLARALRKSGMQACEGLRAEKTADAILIVVPELVDSAGAAARLAAAKHLLDTYLAKPLILKPIPKPEALIALLEQFRQNEPQRPLAATASAFD